jgi:hypothetical protein
MKLSTFNILAFCISLLSSVNSFASDSYDDTVSEGGKRGRLETGLNESVSKKQDIQIYGADIYNEGYAFDERRMVYFNLPELSVEIWNKILAYRGAAKSSYSVCKFFRQQVQTGLEPIGKPPILDMADYAMPTHRLDTTPTPAYGRKRIYFRPPTHLLPEGAAAILEGFKDVYELDFFRLSSSQSQGTHEISNAWQNLHVLVREYGSRRVNPFGPLNGCMQALEVLNLPSSHMGDEEFSELAFLPQLRELYMPDLNYVKNFLPLATLTNLRRLNLSCSTYFTDCGLLQGLTQLEYLNLSNNRFIESLAPLAALKKLRYLDVSCATAKGLCALNDHKELRLLNLSGTVVRQMVVGLENLQVLGLQKALVMDPLNMESFPRLRLLDIIQLSTLHSEGLSALSDKKESKFAHANQMIIKFDRLVNNGDIPEEEEQEWLAENVPYVGIADIEEMPEEATEDYFRSNPHLHPFPSDCFEDYLSRI